MTDPAVLNDLAPGGALRVAVNLANAALVKQQADGSLTGPIAELSAQLAARLGVPPEFIRYPSGGAILAEIGTGRWDIAFLAVDPARADRLAFSRPYTRIEATFIVPAGSSPTRAADADATGLRIATARDAAYELHLRRSFTRAEIVSHDTPSAAIEAVLAGRCDLAAGIRQALQNAAAAHPDLRVLPDAFMAVPQAIAVAIARTRGAAYLDAFIAEIGARDGAAARSSSQ